MILLVHMIFGAAVGYLANNIILALILALLSHYFLDFIPHAEYPIGDLNDKRPIKLLPALSIVALDFLVGSFLIIFFSKKEFLIYACGLIAIIPDGIFAISLFIKNKILAVHEKFHKTIHFLHHKKISNFWRIFNQILIVIISILILNRF